MNAKYHHTVADPHLQIRGGGGHPDPELRGWPSLKKSFFWPFGPQFGPKITGGPRAPRAPPVDPPLSYNR